MSVIHRSTKLIISDAVKKIYPPKMMLSIIIDMKSMKLFDQRITSCRGDNYTLYNCHGGECAGSRPHTNLFDNKDAVPELINFATLMFSKQFIYIVNKNNDDDEFLKVQFI